MQCTGGDSEAEQDQRMYRTATEQPSTRGHTNVVRLVVPTTRAVVGGGDVKDQQAVHRSRLCLASQPLFLSHAASGSSPINPDVLFMT